MFAFLTVSETVLKAPSNAQQNEHYQNKGEKINIKTFNMSVIDFLGTVMGQDE